MRLVMKPKLSVVLSSLLGSLALVPSAYAASPTPTSPTAPAARPAQIPLRDFFRNPEKVGFALSDDGQWISYLAPHQNRLNLFVRPATADLSLIHI